jgi:hypothetical protein
MVRGRAIGSRHAPKARFTCNRTYRSGDPATPIRKPNHYERLPVSMGPLVRQVHRFILENLGHVALGYPVPGHLAQIAFIPF